MRSHRGASTTELRLRELLGEACDDPALAAEVELDTPLRSLGLRSLELVAFFASVETAFGFEWSEDTPSEALRDLGSMAARLAAVGSTGQAPVGGTDSAAREAPGG